MNRSIDFWGLIVSTWSTRFVIFEKLRILFKYISGITDENTRLNGLVEGENIWFVILKMSINREGLSWREFWMFVNPSFLIFNLITVICWLLLLIPFLANWTMTQLLQLSVFLLRPFVSPIFCSVVVWVVFLVHTPSS